MGSICLLWYEGHDYGEDDDEGCEVFSRFKVDFEVSSDSVIKADIC